MNIRFESVETIFGMKAGDAVELISRLTPREMEVAELIAMGLHNKEIAEKLGISPKTQDQHRAKINLKLDTSAHGIPRIWFLAKFAEQRHP